MYKEQYKETEEKCTCDQPSIFIDFRFAGALLNYYLP